MKRIVLQHYDGPLGELEEASMLNIKAYAEMIGVEYKLITGKPFRDFLEPALQKCCIINEEFDEYDELLMVDIDMFTPKGMTENVFDYVGVGLYADVQKRLHKKICHQYPKASSPMAPYWGGAIYKMDRALRQKLRGAMESVSSDNWMKTFTHYHYADEGIFHMLATRCELLFITDHVLDQKWCQCSYLPNPEQAGFIHIRTKVTPTGPKREKIENYRDLLEQGII